MEANLVEEEIPEFSNMAASKETTDLIKKQVQADPNGDFSSITQGFAGPVKSLDKFPEKLNYNDPNNLIYVPAILFTIKQKYSTGAMFKVPCKLEMHTAPNAYVSNCQPYRVGDEHSYSKRYALSAEALEEIEATKADTVFFREYYLFPKQTSTCGSSGYAPKSRYISAFYTTNKCTDKSGFMSIDREFVSTFTSSPAVVGGWKWTREFSEARLVFGTPASFSSLLNVWCLGYAQITWGSTNNFQPSDVAIEEGICQQWPTANWASENQKNKYQENHPSYPMTGVSCKPYKACTSDTTLLGFQNEDPRDFEKRPTSTLLTGPRRAFCSHESQDGADQVVFDTVTFRGANTGAMSKRMFDDSLHAEHHEIHMIYSPEHDGLVHGRHAPHLVHAFNKMRRKRGEKPMIVDPVAAAPHRDNFVTNVATGSVDANGGNGAGAGDHPLHVFPESYSTPLTLDPVVSASKEEPTIYDSELVTGVPKRFCDIGDLGCTCRQGDAMSACDHPYECSSINVCVRPKCPAGSSGCKVRDSGAPCDANLAPSADGKHCVYPPACTAGELGCVCGAENTCSEGSCQDAVCMHAGEKSNTCDPGSPGCKCTASGSCNNKASCDSVSSVCVFKACQEGNKGCMCNTKGSACSDGFACSNDKQCVDKGCISGDAGCECTATKACNKKGFTCVDLNRDGSENVCTGENQCPGGQEARCLEECGPGNVAACGKCTYSRPVCRNPCVQYTNPKSYLYKVDACEELAQTGSSSTLAFAAATVVAAVVALF